MEIVKTIDWYPKWDSGAPEPQVFSNGHKVFLIYTIADWETISHEKANLIESSDEYNEFIALVEFSVNTFRFGIANDEVFSGLPLYNQGLKEWGHVIENSKWIEEVKQIHKVHHFYKEFRWLNKKHYVLLFKDNILEVIAESYKIVVYKSSYREVGKIVLKLLNEV